MRKDFAGFSGLGVGDKELYRTHSLGRAGKKEGKSITLHAGLQSVALQQGAVHVGIGLVTVLFYYCHNKSEVRVMKY